MREGSMIDPTAMPTDGLVITGQYDTTVTFSIDQRLVADNEAVAIRYHDSNLESSCEIITDPTGPLDYESQCVEGMASATVIVYTGSFDVTNCAACDVDDLSTQRQDWTAGEQAARRVAAPELCASQYRVRRASTFSVQGNRCFEPFRSRTQKG